MKKVIAIGLLGMSLVGMSSVANAKEGDGATIKHNYPFAISHSSQVNTDTSYQASNKIESPNAPDVYYQYGEGMVKADGQWVSEK